MTRKKKNTLRRLTEEEKKWLVRISRSQNEAATHVVRAKEILAIAAGNNYYRSCASGWDQIG